MGGQQLALAWPHSSSPGTAASPLLQGMAGRKGLSSSSLSLWYSSILQSLPAQEAPPTPLQSWHYTSEHQHLCQRMLRARPPHEGSRRAGTWGRGQEHQPAAAGFGLFQQLPSQGMCMGWGFPGPGHSVLNNLFIALVSLLSRNGLCSSCTGLAAWVPPVSPPPAPSGIPARRVRLPKTKDSWPS